MLVVLWGFMLRLGEFQGEVLHGQRPRGRRKQREQRRGDGRQFKSQERRGAAAARCSAVGVTGSGLHPKVRSHGFLDSTTNPPFQCPVAVPLRS